jgi:hypothetical protein
VGTRPSHAASYRSFLNSWAEPIMATAASAVMGPTPMIARRRTQRSSKRTAAPPLSSSVGPMSSDSDIARVAIFEIFDKELRLGRPPEVGKALGRLRASGCAEDEAGRLIACVLASEVYAVVRDVQNTTASNMPVTFKHCLNSRGTRQTAAGFLDAFLCCLHLPNHAHAAHSDRQRLAPTAKIEAAQTRLFNQQNPVQKSSSGRRRTALSWRLQRY